MFFCLYKVGRNGRTGIKLFNKSGPVGLRLIQEIITGKGVKCLANWAKLACGS